MKKIILLIFLFVPMITFSQSGGVDKFKVIHRGLIGNGDSILIRIDNNGIEHPLAIDNNTIYIENDTLKSLGTGGEGGTGWNYTTQTLTGTTPIWNVDNGLNAKITLSAATTITFTNLEDGMEGLLTVTNGSSSTYYITFKGYTFDISIAVWRTDTQVAVSGSNKIDKFSWKFDGTTVSINGAFDYKRYTF